MSARLTQDPLDVSTLLASVGGGDVGGTAAFIGTVRRSAEDGDVVGIEYSAYETMADAEFDRILAEAAGRWATARVAVRHRLGLVSTGDVSVVVVAAAPHRAEAFAACRFVIDETKRRVPIWKKEHLATGAARWVAAHPGEGAAVPAGGPPDA
jgi:molybdopterin synthase catalytic subunit